MAFSSAPAPTGKTPASALENRGSGSTSDRGGSVGNRDNRFLGTLQGLWVPIPLDDFDEAPHTPDAAHQPKWVCRAASGSDTDVYPVDQCAGDMAHDTTGTNQILSRAFHTSHDGVMSFPGDGEHSESLSQVMQCQQFCFRLPLSQLVGRVMDPILFQSGEEQLPAVRSTLPLKTT